MTHEGFREIGRQRIAQPEHDTPMIPLTPWRDFPLRFTVEYPVKDFALEVGFWSGMLGLRFLVLDGQYAVCTDAANSFTFSFQATETAHDLSHIKIQWFTEALDDAVAYLTEKQVDFAMVQHSDRQRFVRFRSPAGVTVEVWSGDESSM